MKRLVLSLFLMTLVLWVTSCQNTSTSDVAKESSIPPAGDNHWARGFEVIESPDSIFLLVFDPWNRADTFARYHFPRPVTDFQQWAVFSTTHIGFLEALGEADRVVGCTTPDRIFSPALRKKVQEKKLVRIGSDMDYNIESLHQLHPDLLIQSAFPGQKSRDARLLTSGIEVMYLMEWLEPTPLGRAEWIKVFGLLLNKRAQADSIFRDIEQKYLALKQLADQQSRQSPRVLIGNSFKGTWFMPGGDNYQTRFIEDAGMSYAYMGSSERGSLPLSFEAVLHEFRDAPIWINVSAPSLQELQREDERYELFKAFQLQQVYAYIRRQPDGWANDYWESGVIRPDLVLKDLIMIAHPSLFPNESLYYYTALSE